LARSKLRGPENPYVKWLTAFLRKSARENAAPIWRAVREWLLKPRRRRAEINISKINRYTKNGDVVVVPGKVLGAGELDHRVTVAALSFSQAAKQKIESAGGECISIEELVRRNPRGSGVKIMVG